MNEFQQQQQHQNKLSSLSLEYPMDYYSNPKNSIPYDQTKAFQTITPAPVYSVEQNPTVVPTYNPIVIDDEDDDQKNYHTDPSASAQKSAACIIL